MTNTYSISTCRLLMFVARKGHSEPLCLSWQNVIMKVLRELDFRICGMTKPNVRKGRLIRDFLIVINNRASGDKSSTRFSNYGRLKMGW